MLDRKSDDLKGNMGNISGEETNLHLALLFYFFKILFICFYGGEEREKERERENHQCVRNISIGCLSHALNG